MPRDLADTVKARLRALTTVTRFIDISALNDVVAYTVGATVPLLSEEQIEKIEPAIRDLIAEATADGLEAAAGCYCDNCKHGIPLENSGTSGPVLKHWYTGEAGKIIYVPCLSPRIRALAPDIAAKAKEHDAKIEAKAYLRCAEYLSVGGPWPIDTFRKWANEADGGG
jgi:hypothetical protein